MGIEYKVNILEKLKEAGYSTYVLRKDKILGEKVIQKLREGNTDITLNTLDTICNLLGCSVDELVEHKKL